MYIQQGMEKPRLFTKENRQRPSPKNPSTKRGPPTPQKSPVPQAIRQHAQRETSDHHKKQREGTTAPPPAHAPSTPRTTHTHFHTEPPQQPIDEPQTPCDRDEIMTEENPAAIRGKRCDPRPELVTPNPYNWHEMSKNAKERWRRTQRGKGRG